MVVYPLVTWDFFLQSAHLMLHTESILLLLVHSFPLYRTNHCYSEYCYNEYIFIGQYKKSL